MTIEIARLDQGYSLSGVPLFGSFDCSRSSERLNIVDCFDFSAMQGMSFQSVAHSIIVRSALFDDNKKSHECLDYSDEYQRTSTVSLKFFDNGLPFVAFVDLDMSHDSRNILREGLATGRHFTSRLFLSLNEFRVSQLLNVARSTNRIVPAIKFVQGVEGNPLVLSLSEYGSHPYSIAVFGSRDIARVQADHLRKKGYSQGLFYDYTNEDLEELLQEKEGFALVCPVGVGGVGCSSENSIISNDYFYHYVGGRSRGYGENI